VENPLHQPSAGPPPRPGEDREDLAALAERAARLCKADLVTGMVGEFPELQGVIGGHLARAQGEHPAVADAIRDHYKPVGQGDEVPTAPVTVAVSLADKLDTLGLFVGLRPSGQRSFRSTTPGWDRTVRSMEFASLEVAFCAERSGDARSKVAAVSLSRDVESTCRRCRNRGFDTFSQRTLGSRISAERLQLGLLGCRLFTQSNALSNFFRPTASKSSSAKPASATT
jgi:hypothetical protein